MAQRAVDHAWAQIYLPRAGWIEFDPRAAASARSALSPLRSCAIHSTRSRSMHLIGFPSDISYGGASECHIRYDRYARGGLATPQRSTRPQIRRSFNQRRTRPSMLMERIGTR